MPADTLAAHTGGLRTALYNNQRLWLIRLATGETVPPSQHARLWRTPLLTAAHTGQTGVMCLIGHDSPGETTAALTEALAWLRTRNCGDVLVWSAGPRPDLDLCLAAHGLDAAFQPHWMTRLLTRHLPRPSTGQDVDIHLARARDLDALRRSTTIPYVNADQFPAIERLVAVPVRQRRVWILVARDRRDRTVLGQAIVNLCDGSDGRFAGLYNLGVDAAARRRGIGTALTTAACNLARDLNARAIGLNATAEGERLYRTLGFEPAGEGQTWHLPARRLMHPPGLDLVAFAMAISMGAPALDAWHLGEPLPTRVPNGESPLSFAARTGNADTVRWLLNHGAAPEIVPLWAVGLRDEAEALLAQREAVERRMPPLHGTPLHEAIRRGDAALARLLITAGADLEARDDRYRSTPLGWAEALHQDEIAAMIRDAAHASSRGKETVQRQGMS
jgi:ribosomal protein S18 acetylase RimI-like enzyme